MNALDMLAERDRRALVVFEGMFYGPEPIKIDPRLPAAIKKRLKGAKRRYGHMDSFETMIRVTSVKYVEAVSATATQ
jgi:hypothetical protein